MESHVTSCDMFPSFGRGFVQMFCPSSQTSDLKIIVFPDMTYIVHLSLLIITPILCSLLYHSVMLTPSD